MKFELKVHRELRGIPSASGIEITPTGIYVIGDDSPILFELDENFNLTNKIQLFPGRNLSEGIIEKLLKPDLEALTKGDKDGNILLAFGSGSKSPERDIMVEIDLSTKNTREYSLVKFYSHLRSLARLSEEQLNIEAAEVYKDNLLLFNRGENLIFKCSLCEFKDYLKDGKENPDMQVYKIDLPEIGGIKSGFSGASVDPENGILYFTATVENTDNWIDDGEVLGSFIGIINLTELKNGMNPDHIAITLDKDHLRIKVESIAVIPPFQPGKAEVVMVTDSDGGISELLLGTLFIDAK